MKSTINENITIFPFLILPLQKSSATVCGHQNHLYSIPFVSDPLLAAKSTSWQLATRRQCGCFACQCGGLVIFKLMLFVSSRVSVTLSVHYSHLLSMLPFQFISMRLFCQPIRICLVPSMYFFEITNFLLLLCKTKCARSSVHLLILTLSF